MTLDYWFMLPRWPPVWAARPFSRLSSSWPWACRPAVASSARGSSLRSLVLPAPGKFADGLYAYARKRLIDYRLGVTLLVVTIPAALLGTWAAGWIEPDIMRAAPCPP